MASRLTPLSKALITVIVLGAVGAAVYRNKGSLEALVGQGGGASTVPAPGVPGTSPSGKHTYRVALSQWPGHMPLVVAMGGLTTQPGSAAAAEGLDLAI